MFPESESGYAVAMMLVGALMLAQESMASAKTALIGYMPEYRHGMNYNYEEAFQVRREAWLTSIHRAVTHACKHAEGIARQRIAELSWRRASNTAS